ncbi:signal peptide peptidase-like 2A isoform X3 [Synchiropus splendidus]|uniref:signal peptide peptidase-like 2A isoform X3 n=1 Tax=Synchiropus splendidus TaxID=270530 RepID=UPI00237EC63E|nr:signal peptide peptidase-like 2A isoform X3 [Synchiropus splendidus]
MERTFLIFVLTVFCLTPHISCQEAVLRISNGSSYLEYCLLYNGSLTPLPPTVDAAVQILLVNLTSSLLCDPSGVSPELVKGKAVVVMRGVCEFQQKAVVAQSVGAAALLIASNTTLFTPSFNESESEKIQIPVGLIRQRDFLEANQVFGESMEVRLYAPVQPQIDPSIFVMLLIAVLTVALGSYWSGASERDRLNEGPPLGGSGDSKADSRELFVYSPLRVLMMVAAMCGMLLLMYFFYNILVYFFIAIFALASATSLFSCFDAVLDLLHCPRGSFSVRSRSFSVRSLILAAVCVSISVVWVVYRNDDRWVWILHDLLGIAFCLNFIKTISLSNFKVCVVLLSLLLVYDVFFVFITPFFTKDGESIMVQVALGPGASGEKLPVVMRVPRFTSWPLRACGMQFSILGYGDIIVPGLLVAYCSRFDVWINSRRKVYFVSCCIAYLLGMIATFAAMLLSGMGQPALLYLVPFTLITSAVVAGCRKEMRHFWSGTTYEVLDSPREPLLPE